MPDNVFKYIKRNRELFLELVNGLTIEQLNKIPEGFNNNIAWNFGHIVVSTQALCYVRPNVKPDIEIRFAAKYQKGSKPESFIPQEEIDALKQLLLSTINTIEADVKQGVFEKITPYATATYKYEMNTIEEILTAILAHESLHYGYALAQRKLVV
ncbi:DinB family protein [Parafilimonas terrae]|uniref:DinB superfamily protein n=1 Tax=Parafilimonas terrae TaxID=1465490 RepID=A0A1I5U802_9BACT|nr:DinB family protein [Parafilimonas terrae]SFP91380.1 DinB superfamily protein [Parafilimonas terrae]